MDDALLCFRSSYHCAEALRPNWVSVTVGAMALMRIVGANSAPRDFTKPSTPRFGRGHTGVVRHGPNLESYRT